MCAKQTTLKGFSGNRAHDFLQGAAARDVQDGTQAITFDKTGPAPSGGRVSVCLGHREGKFQHISATRCATLERRPLGDDRLLCRAISSGRIRKISIGGISCSLHKVFNHGRTRDAVQSPRPDRNIIAARR